MWRRGDWYTAADVSGDTAADILGLVVTFLGLPWRYGQWGPRKHLCLYPNLHGVSFDVRTLNLAQLVQVRIGLRIWALWESTECACEDRQHADSQQVLGKSDEAEARMNDTRWRTELHELTN